MNNCIQSGFWDRFWTSSVHFVNSEPVPFGFIWTGLSAEIQRILGFCFPEKTDVYLFRLTRTGSWTRPASFPRYWRLFRWTKQPRRDSDHSPHCSVAAESVWSGNSAPAYVFIALCLSSRSFVSKLSFPPKLLVTTFQHAFPSKSGMPGFFFCPCYTSSPSR